MKLPPSKRKQIGFTLIELLIVVAIISILIAIGLASYSRVQKSARDSQRKSDLRNVAGALEQFYSDWNVYPRSTVGTGLIRIHTTNCSGAPNYSIAWGSSAFRCGPAGNEKTYLAQVPNDPLTSRTYYYFACPATSTSPQLYILYAHLEKSESMKGPPCSCTNMTGLVCGGAVSGNSEWFYVIPQ
jgi:prepilin-type N-terminal cleavage/methylation domain-containing protein